MLRPTTGVVFVAATAPAASVVASCLFTCACYDCQACCLLSLLLLLLLLTAAATSAAVASLAAAGVAAVAAYCQLERETPGHARHMHLVLSRGWQSWLGRCGVPRGWQSKNCEATCMAIRGTARDDAWVSS
jgi:hypothetical protein